MVKGRFLADAQTLLLVIVMSGIGDRKLEAERQPTGEQSR